MKTNEKEEAISHIPFQTKLEHKNYMIPIVQSNNLHEQPREQVIAKYME